MIGTQRQSQNFEHYEKVSVNKKTVSECKKTTQKHNELSVNKRCLITLVNVVQ